MCRIARTIRSRLRDLTRKLPALSSYAHRIDDVSSELATLRSSMYVPPGHFYSPYPSLDDLRARRSAIFDRDLLDLPGIDLRIQDQLALFNDLVELLPTVDFGDDTDDLHRYGYDNPTFSYGDGTFLFLMLSWLRPQRLIEIGSGHSSACALDTIDHIGSATACRFIEPYDDLLRSLIRPADLDRVEIVATPLQDVPLADFSELAKGDLLFIDSTHVSKAGSDVNYLFFEVLPSLASGVVIHFHDVFPGFEYPWEWAMEGRAWTEDYLLRAFLQYNSEFEILIWPSLLAHALPRVSVQVPQLKRNPGGSIYLRRR